MGERRMLRGWLFGACALIAAVALVVPLWAAAAPASSGTVQQVAIGAYVNFTGTGFEVGETISLQAAGPDGSQTPLSGTEASGTGSFTVSVSFPSAGMWQVTAHGNTSGNEFMGRFSVGETSPTPAPPSANTTPVPTTAAAPGAPVPSSAASAPSAANSAVVPQGLPPGTSVTTIGASSTYSGNGFNAGEEIGRWMTAPDGGAVTAVNNTYADNTGAFSDTATFPSGGLWQITAHGKESGHEVISRFYVTGESTATSPGTPAAVGPSTTANLVKTNPSQRVPFASNGFSAYETVSVWVTSPEGSVTTLDSVQANGGGRVTITTTFPSAGVWSITAHGQTSGKEVVGRYQVVAS